MMPETVCPNEVASCVERTSVATVLLQRRQEGEHE